MLFFNLKIQKTNTQKDSISFISTVKAEGNFNEETDTDHDHFLSTLVCELYDCNQKLLKSVNVENPIYRKVDLYNENGNIEAKTLNLNEAEFSFRVNQTNEKICFIKIIKKEQNSTQTLNSLPIP